MKKTKFVGFLSALLACLMLVATCFAACGDETGPVGEGTTKKPIKDGDVCIGLEIKKNPRLEYKEGEKFNPAGLVFDAVYQNGFDGDTDLIGADLDGYLPRTPLTWKDTKITLIFEGFRKEIDITVVAKKPLSVEITREPDIRSYYVGDALDLSGLTVKAEYEEETVENEQTYTVTDAEGNEYKQGDILEKATGVTELTVTVGVGADAQTDTFFISVYQGLTLQAEDHADVPPETGSYTVLSGKAPNQLINTNGTYTGKAYIGNISKGVVIEFNLYTEEAIENADLVLVASSTCQGETGMEDMQFNKLYKVYVDEGEGYREIFIDDDVFIEGKEYPPAGSGGSRWTNWADVPFGRIDLAVGYTKVKLECIGAVKDRENFDRTPNVDRLDVRATDGDTEVTRGDIVTDITITTNPKTAYKEGETFDPTGLVFDVTYRNGYEGDKGLGANRLHGFTPTGKLTPSDTKAGLTFKNFTKEIDITVAPKTVTSIAIDREPDTTAYSKGGALNLGGMLVKATYDDGTADNVTGYTVKDASGKTYENGTLLNETGDLELIVEYANRTATFTVSVSDGVTVQAEAILADGESAPTNRSYTVLTKGGGNINTAQGSGNGCIENVAPARGDVAATKVEFFIYSDVAFTGADLVFTLASTNNNGTSRMGNMPFNKLFRVTVGEGADEEELTVGDGAIIEGKEALTGLNRWFLWSEVNVGKIDVKAGFTKVTLECIGQVNCADGSARAANIDCLNIRMSNTPDVRGKTIQSVEITHAPDYVTYGAHGMMTLDGMVVKATYTDGTVVSDAENYIIKDADGNRYGECDKFGSEAKDLNLTVEISDGTTSKSAPLNIRVNPGTPIAVEAEAKLESGATAPTDVGYTVITGSHSVKTGLTNANGNQAVESIETNTQIDFYVYSDRAVNGATLVLRACSLNRGTNLTKDVQFNKIFELYVNDVKINIGDGVKIKGRSSGTGDSIWFLFTDNELTGVNLSEGFTKISLKAIGKVKDDADGSNRTSNIDGIQVVF